jgi:hypothetical protein
MAAISTASRGPGSAGRSERRKKAAREVPPRMSTQGMLTGSAMPTPPEIVGRVIRPLSGACYTEPINKLNAMIGSIIA